MRLSDLFSSATTSLSRNKSRSLLTVLGIVIGIAAVIVMLSIGQGAQGYILHQIADLGSDQVFVEPGQGNVEGGPPSPFVEQTVTLADVEILRQQGDFGFVAATLITNAVVDGDEASLFTDIVGVDEHQLLVFPAEVANGRFVDADDVQSSANVVVLGYEIATDLFGDSDPLDKRLKVKDVQFRVIGIMNEQGSRFFSNLDRQIYIPVTTMQRKVLGVDYINYIALKAPGDIDEAKEEVRLILRDAHNLDNPEGDLGKDDFRVSSQSDAVQTISFVGFALSLLLASIAAISLLVGGIGIMNIMLVSVTERTKEIGLRKAIGATASEILHQFLLEAVLLTMVGGAIGILLGVGFSFFLGLIAQQFIDGWAIVIPPIAIVLSVVVSSVVGIIFGYYPAKNAAKLDPIAALRYE